MKSTVKPANASSHIRLVTGERPPTPIRLAGLSPAETMEPGQYLAQCVAARLERSKNRAVLDFAVVDGPCTGVAVTQWINGVNTAIQPGSRYAKECTAALGRELSAADDLDPGVVFKDKILFVQVGYRLTEKAGGGRASDEFALTKKDGRDFLRVLRILGPGEL